MQELFSAGVVYFFPSRHFVGKHVFSHLSSPWHGEQQCFAETVVEIPQLMVHGSALALRGGLRTNIRWPTSEPLLVGKVDVVFSIIM